ncbi:hypothetical protein, unknown function [Leishmania infantum JPCM5]|uniref:Uncharacterized protein n=2 Tax=Leishmania infantum TaxID=5671 RepID=A4ID36_LEIIN|nr:hypothetical protein, unknown function [Leishmania infantum JPCM5]CAC9551336.1 hypothetical_protein_-_conserved [Leishmania infantum]CAM72765.1 hypothetical protein, unknown function [Leishmania infantum JPCM5]SUZ46758.1 hypothetical_protein_-_conserved [Leishmania infantum]|eukprot:XP_001469655.1 hypothetical protein, unknown function [Leishmania infantum JPCM5]
MHRVFLVRSSDAMATTTSTDSDVDCNHGVWDAATLTCDCDAGWCTDWLNQDVLGGNYVYCNSQASTPPPSNSSATTTSFLADKSTLIIIVALAVVLAALCGIVVFYCYRKKRRRAKEEAKGAEIVAAANEEARRQEALQLQQMQVQVQEEAALQQQLWAAQLEAQRRNQALLNHLVSMSTMPAASNSQLSASSRHHRRHWHEMLPRHQGEVAYACDADYEGGNSLAETFDGWGSQEPFVQCPSSYRRGAPLSATDGYNNYPDILPSYYTATTTEAPRREVNSPPPYAQLAFRHPPF